MKTTLKVLKYIFFTIGIILLLLEIINVIFPGLIK